MFLGIRPLLSRSRSTSSTIGISDRQRNSGQQRFRDLKNRAHRRLLRLQWNLEYSVLFGFFCCDLEMIKEFPHFKIAENTQMYYYSFNYQMSYVNDYHKLVDLLICSMHRICVTNPFPTCIDCFNNQQFKYVLCYLQIFLPWSRSIAETWV